jgi:transposase InsO family protein
MAIRSDQGGEFTSTAFKDELQRLGIIAELTPARTPQSNGLAERVNRTLNERNVTRK